ncbi:hypothetical protein [Allorhodopirellula solitaria]|uniref:hypothetical protein n=1 Tax=Allorhodopirellula solitaria TaxID=2527987 RepID=UPI00164437C4|nr:hypothetical protein [Allorhodopirellula solitaria]
MSGRERGIRADITHAVTDSIVDSHLATAITITLDPTPTGPAATNRDRLDVFELTIEVPFPQPRSRLEAPGYEPSVPHDGSRLFGPERPT